MGWYETHILPRLVDWVLRGDDVDRIRAQIAARVRGVVLEIGFGSGRNVPFLPAGVSRVVAIEPSPTARRLAGGRCAASRVPIAFMEASALALPLLDASIDSVLSTWTLCTLPDLQGTLRELRRVLVPGGLFCFAEHGLSPQPGVARWQRRLEPLHKRLAGGCHLTRDIAAELELAGFSIVRLENRYLGWPRTHKWLFLGEASRGAT